jgi:hypothetical protein
VDEGELVRWPEFKRAPTWPVSQGDGPQPGAEAEGISTTDLFTIPICSSLAQAMVEADQPSPSRLRNPPAADPAEHARGRSHEGSRPL